MNKKEAERFLDSIEQRPVEEMLALGPRTESDIEAEIELDERIWEAQQIASRRPGRPRLYANNAEKAKAYRARKKDAGYTSKWVRLENAA